MEANKIKSNAVSKTIHVIGVSGGGVKDLSESLQELILSTKKISAPKRMISSFVEWWKKNSSSKSLPELYTNDKTTEVISWLKKQTQKTILFSSGDPLWFGIGRTLLEEFDQNQLIFHPSPTSLQLAFARLGKPWQDTSWVSLHGRDSTIFQKLLQQKPKSIGILADPKNSSIEEVRILLKTFELEKIYQFWIFEQLGGPKEYIQRLLPSQKTPIDIDPLHLIVLIKEEKDSIKIESLPLFGIADSEYIQYKDRPGLLTKREVRIQILADLELPKAGIIWDIGAGVGSIGLEALRISPKLKLMSLERRLGGKELINSNAENLSVKPYKVIESELLEAIKEKKIPDKLLYPDRVILGGGGSERNILLKEILKRIKSKGIIVIPLATLEAIGEIKQVLEKAGCLLKISQHQSFRGIPLAKGTRLAPMNPVFIVKAKIK